MELKGKLIAKARNGKGFKIEGVEGWLTANEPVMPYLEKIEKGTDVVVTYEKKGIYMNASKIMRATVEKSVEEKPEEVKTEEKKTYPTKTWTPKPAGTSFNNPERDAQIRRGNSLNAAAAVLAGREEDPETLAEMTLVVAQKFLDWLELC